MGDTKIRSVTVEVSHLDADATLVIREPGSSQQQVYLAGDLPVHITEGILRQLGLDVAPSSVSRADTPPPSTRRGPASVGRSVTEMGGKPLSSSPSALAEHLEELVGSVLRAGRRCPTSTVDELLERARKAATSRTPVFRALARLEEGFDPDAPSSRAALALAALGELVHALRNPASDLGREVLETPRDEALEPCTLVEIGRRRERGALGWETRMLFDVSSGTLLREEGPFGSRILSRGSVGRCVSVTLGRTFDGLVPRRAVIQQYEYEPAASREHLERLLASARSDLPDLSPSGLELVLVPQPTILRVQRIELDQQASCISTPEVTIPLRNSPQGAATSVLQERLRGSARIRCIAGSLEIHPLETGAGLVLVPWSALLEKDGETQLLDLGS